MATQEQTAKCEDCGKRVSRYFGTGSGYPQGVQTATGHICGVCMMKRHEADE